MIWGQEFGKKELPVLFPWKAVILQIMPAFTENLFHEIYFGTLKISLIYR